METPTLYKLNMTDGTTRLMEISGGPGWGNGFTGWKSSISDDNGETWSDYKEWYNNGNKTIVAMASLIQLKDEEGNLIDKWMGVYHDFDYVNYRTYLTFDENGNEQWSNPEPYLSEWRDVERTTQLCEVGMFRSPDGNQLVMLARSQSHMNKSTIAFSNDEGKTWTKPREVQGALNGERHKISYDPISGRLLVTFREIILDYNKNGVIENNDWMAGEWVAWVG
ncbi:MAG: exo-alpha-sialidase, partial [Erysipelotrichaceae bacterium]